MSIKIYWEGNGITNIVGTVTWSGSDYQAARTIDFTILNPAGDKNFDIPNIKVGDRITFWDDDKKLFHGKVTAKHPKGEAGTRSYTAMDYMANLLRSKGTYKFKNKSPEKITELVCKDLKIKIGTLKKTGMKIPKIFFQEKEYYNIILAAYTKARWKTGKKYMPIMQADKLSVIEKGTMLDVTLNQKEGIIESTYDIDTDSMVNRVVIYDEKNVKIGTVSNADWVKKYGVFQEAITVDSGTGKTEAKNTLSGAKKNASLTAIGDIRCISGYGIKINDVDSGIVGNFWIENDTHTFENGIHKMSLELAFKNTMDVQYGDEEESSSSSSKTVSTGILNGKKVKAVFTAYYPANNKMEGGYYDCKGKKLDPSKYTCAAPSNVAYGKQIQVLSTGTSRDKKVHTVNDRGGAIKVKNGVYHFDLLMKTKTQCNKFGRRNGYAIIGNGTGFKQTTETSQKSDKVVKKAKSYIGKVRYVFGASSPDRGKSDCSGFTQYVYKKAAGKSIGRTTSEQVRKGKRIEKSKLKAGDLVFFKNTYNSGYIYGVSHVGIYVGNGKFVHCSSSGGVKASNLYESYYSKHWLMGRRVL